MKTLVSYHPRRRRAHFPGTFINELFNLDDFFSRELAQTVGSDNTMNSPSVNIVKLTNGLKLEVAAPGLVKDDFNIMIEEDHLVLSAEKKGVKAEAAENTETAKNAENAVNTETFTRREFDYSSFKRSFRLPENINTDEISATYENGILAITLPELEEADKPEKKKVIDIS